VGNIAESRLLTVSVHVLPLQSINEKPQVIQEYECGKAIPNPQVLSKLSRILGVQLKKWAVVSFRRS